MHIDSNYGCITIDQNHAFTLAVISPRLQASTMMTTGTYLTQLLAEYGVKHVFGIPGVHTLELYRGLSESSITHITPRHEQGAGFMADGYARASARPGVCFIISGPGMTNITTPMGQAYADSIPMLVISTVNAHGHMGSGEGWLHELPNQQALISGVCAFSHTVHSADELPSVLARAFAVFDSERPRPVHIELPINVILATHTPPLRTPVAPRLRPPTGNSSAIQEAASKIVAAKGPLILVGGGAIDASDELQKLVDDTPMPVVMTVNARGVLPVDHPMAVAASASLPAVRKLVEQADLVLAVGTELGSTDYDFNEDGYFNIPGELVRIDIDPQQIMRSYMPELGISGDAKDTLMHLITAINTNRQNLANDLSSDDKDHQRSERSQSALRAVTQTVDAVKQSLSERDHCYVNVLETIRDSLPGVVIIGDSTQIIYAGNSTFAAAQPASYFNSATGFGTLGYALPAAIGGSLAKTQCPIVAIAGDGGIQFSLGELATAIDAKTNITLIVHENGGYAEIKKYMQSSSIEPVGVDLTIPDLLPVATAFGWFAHRLSHLAELPEMLRSSAKLDTPSLLLLPDSIFKG
ncbi:MAG: 5-guanidino-2-oxopentanoate decarboxylase [Granulosicoccus sp.]